MYLYTPCWTWLYLTKLNDYVQWCWTLYKWDFWKWLNRCFGIVPPGVSTHPPNLTSGLYTGQPASGLSNALQQCWIHEFVISLQYQANHTQLLLLLTVKYILPVEIIMLKPYDFENWTLKKICNVWKLSFPFTSKYLQLKWLTNFFGPFNKQICSFCNPVSDTLLSLSLVKQPWSVLLNNVDFFHNFFSNFDFDTDEIPWLSVNKLKD